MTSQSPSGRQTVGIVLATVYELLALGVLGLLSWREATAEVGTTPVVVREAFRCALAAGWGGTLYCIRGIYLNHAVHNQWDNRWLIWYLLRPIGSVVCGIAAYVFIRAGLAFLDASNPAASGGLGAMALAFIAGLNVDRFVEKLEDIAQAAWGIKKSRTSEPEKPVTPKVG